jgi:tetratricopeptide (TPR) repeat protein
MTLNNSGLAHYAAGHFDEALRLQTEALEFATRSQSDRARARSYYGIGVTYYAIGDSELATRFLNSALEISTAQFNARQRAITLRALAVVEHENGQLREAIAHNSEALSLSAAPLTRARILLHLAGDYADDGDPAHALNLIKDLLSHPPGGDPLVRGMALEERGTLSRLSGDFAAAERDLLESIRVFVRFDSLADRFEAEVKLAQLSADQHRPDDALAESPARIEPVARDPRSNGESGIPCIHRAGASAGAGLRDRAAARSIRRVRPARPIGQRPPRRHRGSQGG